MTEIPKRRFEFEPFDGQVDVYVDGKKIRGPHRGNGGNVALRIPEDENVELTVAIHDPDIGIDFEITPTGLERIIREPKTLPSLAEAAKARDAAEAAIKAKDVVAKAEREAKIQAIKDEARARGAASKAAAKAKEEKGPLGPTLKME